MNPWHEVSVLDKSTRQIMEQSQRIGIQFLLADLTVALTFIDVAEVTRSGEVRKRNLENARSAYQTVLRLLPRVLPSEDELSALEAKLTELKARLVASGCDLHPEAKGRSET